MSDLKDTKHPNLKIVITEELGEISEIEQKAEEQYQQERDELEESYSTQTETLREFIEQTCTNYLLLLNALRKIATDKDVPVWISGIAFAAITAANEQVSTPPFIPLAE